MAALSFAFKNIQFLDEHTNDSILQFNSIQFVLATLSLDTNHEELKTYMTS